MRPPTPEEAAVSTAIPSPRGRGSWAASPRAGAPRVSPRRAARCRRFRATLEPRAGVRMWTDGARGCILHVWGPRFRGVGVPRRAKGGPVVRPRVQPLGGDLGEKCARYRARRERSIGDTAWVRGRTRGGVRLHPADEGRNVHARMYGGWGSTPFSLDLDVSYVCAVAFPLRTVQ